MDERHIRDAVASLRAWCFEVIDSGPHWSRDEALGLVDKCHGFSRGLHENLLFLSEHSRRTWGEVCEEMLGVLFRGHENFCFGGDLGRRVAKLCLNLGRRAPRGWHSRLMKQSEAYRDRFRRP